MYCALYDSGLNAQGFMLEGSNSQLSRTPVCPRDGSHEVLPGFGAHSFHGSQLVLIVLLTSSCHKLMFLLARKIVGRMACNGCVILCGCSGPEA